jgi:O-antigen/teichoic acid export membrane protein
MAGRHRLKKERRELYANTIAAWIWSQGTLVVSVLTLPLLTRFLSADEFGLWTQLLSLSALATVADMGMSLVFLRRMTDDQGTGRAAVLRSATAFYRLSTAVLVVVLLVICLIPGGLLTPYLAHTSLPVVATIAVIAAIGVNLRCQASTLRLLARGRMDTERIFGAGPAVAGTLVSVAAAYFYRTAAAVAIGYAVVEIAFDVALVIVAHRGWPVPREPYRRAGVRTLAWWWRLWYESTGILMIDLVPMISLTIGVAVVGHVSGPAAAAVYGVAAKAGSLVRRFITPFTESLFVSLCRATAPTRAAVARLAARLSVVALAGGVTAAFLVVAAGAVGMRLIFGAGYAGAVPVVLVLVLADTVRSMYRPFVRRVQSENGMGWLRYWFLASMIAQLPLAVATASRWSATGAAAAVLACAIVFEAGPVAWKLSTYYGSPGAGARPVLGQAAAAVGAAGLVVLLAWARQRIGLVAVGVSALAALATGLAGLRQILRYLAAARPVTGSSLRPDSRQEA